MTPVIRPSLLTQASRCSYVGWAAARGQSASAAARRGSEIDRWITRWAIADEIGAGPAPEPWIEREVCDVLRSLRVVPESLAPQMSIRLPLPCGREMGGTTDLVAVDQDRRWIIVDWKTGYGRTLPPMHRDYQLAAYGHGLRDLLGPEQPIRLARALLAEDGNRVDSCDLEEGVSVEQIDHVVRAQLATRIEDIPEIGPQCDTCYHCASCPAHHAEIEALEAEPEPAPIDVPHLLGRWLAVKRAGAQIEDMARAGGAAIALVDGRTYGPKPGRRSVDDVPLALLECERMGVRVQASSKLSLPIGTIEKAAKAAGIKGAVDALEQAGAIKRGTEWGIL